MKLGRIIGSLAIIGVCLFVLLVTWTTTQGKLYQTEYGPMLRNEFQFNHGSPYIEVAGERREVFTIHPKNDGPLYMAGFRDGDIIISKSITGFYKLLYNARGKQVSVEVVAGGDGAPIEQRRVRKIHFKIPIERPTN